MTSVGLILRTERERQGRETAGIAEELCITQRYVRAIERDDLETLPNNFFYKSFVRQYAAILGVDHEVLKPGIQQLTADSEPPLPGADPKHPVAEAPPVRDLDPLVRDGNRRYLPDSRIGMSLTGLIAVMLLCSAFYAWWNKPQRRTSSQPSGMAVVTAAVAPATAPAPEPPPDPAIAAAPVTEAVSAMSDEDVNHVVLSLSATEKTWLSITSEGKQIFSGVLEPSETKTLTATEAAKLKVGNAGGLEVMWNGKPIGPIGPRGQVRVVLFTPENFQILGPSQAL